ncbi:MAG TPA: hypothetical protein VJV78_08620 [Polyangiales bacterium]|nr:hypothetical protein [Polyangiales bacterium]
MQRDAAYVRFVGSSSYPLRAGCSVRPLVDGEPAFRRICQAVEAARKSVWVTVAFLQRELRLPDGRGSFFDVLDRARARGVDVRALFWRCPELEAVEPGTHFSGPEFGIDTSELDDRSGLQSYARLARENAARREKYAR